MIDQQIGGGLYEHADSKLALQKDAWEREDHNHID